MKYRELAFRYSVVFAFVVCLVIVIDMLRGPTPSTVVQPAAVEVPVVDPPPPDPTKTVIPLAELDMLLNSSIVAEFPTIAFDLELLEQREKYLQFKSAGGTMWGSENWMKSPDYYKSLDTPELAIDCFERQTFFQEMMFFDDPRFAYLRLSIMHDGFAEFFAREDIWEGLIHAMDDCASKLTPGNDLSTILRASMTLDALTGSASSLPVFEASIQGHEQEFYEASLSALKKYRNYLRDYDPDQVGTETPFYGEATTVARATLRFLEQVNAEHYERVAPTLRAYRFSQDQNAREMMEYLNLAVDLLEAED